MTAPKYTPAQKKIHALRKSGWQMVQIVSAVGCSRRAFYNWIGGAMPGPVAMESLLALAPKPPERSSFPGRPVGSKKLAK